MRLAPALLAAAALAAQVGCGGRNLPGDVTWESEHFAYKTRTGEQVACADILATLEDHFQSMQRVIGFDWPQGAKVTYYKFENVVDYKANSDCGATADACAPGTTVETSEAFNPHELVHAYLHETGFPPPLLLEGAAVALSCASWRRAQPTLSWREAFGLTASGPRARAATSTRAAPTRPAPRCRSASPRSRAAGTRGRSGRGWARATSCCASCYGPVTTS